MGREIKFRAWDKKWQKMIPFKDIGLHWGEFEIQRRSENGDKIEICEEESGEFELMQYTCLNDRNGKEICEGDIIDYHGDGARSRCHVIFEDGQFQRKYKGGRLWQSLYLSVCQWAIIGNVYENPELML